MLVLPENKPAVSVAATRIFMKTAENYATPCARQGL
jgi:hypothetical protein